MKTPEIRRVIAILMIPILLLNFYTNMAAYAVSRIVSFDTEKAVETAGLPKEFCGDIPADGTAIPVNKTEAENRVFSASSRLNSPADGNSRAASASDAVRSERPATSSDAVILNPPVPETVTPTYSDAIQAGFFSLGDAVLENGISLDKYLSYGKGVQEDGTVSGRTDGILYPYKFSFEDGSPFPGGRFLNPVYKDRDGTEYIVIASKAQLEAIGTGKKVTGGWAKIQFKFKSALLNSGWGEGTITESYIGDMDTSLNSEEIGSHNISIASDGNEAGASLSGTLTVTVGIGDTGKTYAANENYLFVNDIDMQGADWTPWDYTGKFIKGEATLESGDVRNPVISNLNVVEGVSSATGGTENVRGSSQKGVGFFGAVYSPYAGEDVKAEESQRPWWDVIGNLLAGVGKLLTGLVKTLGGLVMDLVGLVSGWSDITTLTSERISITGLTLNNITVNTDGLYETTDKNGGTVENPMPVGAFAGQITGAVTVKNCYAMNVHGINAKQWAGGFTGKTVGATNYLLNGTTAGLKGLLEGLGGTLDSVLNFLLPTDDLITGLLDGLGVDRLIPTRYIPVEIADSGVVFAPSGSVTASGEYAGGFAGRLQGTTLSGCFAEGISSVSASANAGGFAGRVNNAQLVGLLQGLGVNLVNFPVGCTLTNCMAIGNELQVESTKKDDGDGNTLAYAGGFAGAVMASDIVYSDESTAAYDGNSMENTETAALPSAFCGVTGLSEVTAAGGCVGGFAGYAGVGDLAEALNLLSNVLDLNLNLKTGADGTVEVPLGTGLSDLLDRILGVNLNAGILSLIGLSPAQLVGCRVEGVEDGFSVASTGEADRVGGFAGFLNGGRIAGQLVEETYSRVQATDAEGTPLYVGTEAVTTPKKTVFGTIESLDIKGAVYARLSKGEIICEDVHGNKLTGIVPVTPDNHTAVYNIYDNVFINLSDKEKAPGTVSTFRDQDWNAVVYGEDEGDKAGNPISNAMDLPGYDNLAFPVYQQTTTAEGYVQFTYNYTKEEETGGETKTRAVQEILFRGESSDGTYIYYTRNEDGTYEEYENVDTESLSVEALQVSADDSMEETEVGTVVTTCIRNLASVSGGDYTGGIAGQAKLCSAVDLLSNLTTVQYERFEINHVNVNVSDIQGGGVFA